MLPLTRHRRDLKDEKDGENQVRVMQVPKLQRTRRAQDKQETLSKAVLICHSLTSRTLQSRSAIRNKRGVQDANFLMCPHCSCWWEALLLFGGSKAHR